MEMCVEVIILENKEENWIFLLVKFRSFERLVLNDDSYNNVEMLVDAGNIISSLLRH